MADGSLQFYLMRRTPQHFYASDLLWRNRRDFAAGAKALLLTKVPKAAALHAHKFRSATRVGR
jgi:hypothetical protein